MKVAVCFYGLVGGGNNFQKSHRWMNVEDSESFCAIGHRHYKEHIFDKNDEIDVFVHTWSTDRQEEIQELYNPVSAVYEQQIAFPNRPKYQHKQTDRKVWGGYSRWYSTKSVVDLKKQYEKTHNFTYDWVMLTRFDIAFMAPLQFDQYNMNNFYASGQKNKQHEHMTSKKYVADWWFFSNSKNIDNFAALYDEIDRYGRLDLHGYQHRMARTRINDIGLSNRLQFVLNRDDDNKLIRELLSNPQCKNRGNWWSLYGPTGLYAPDSALPTSELNPGKRRHPKWKD